MCIGCLTSLVSLAWGATSYARTVRFTNTEKNNISWRGTVVLLLWHTFSITARVVAMVLFASTFRLWLIAVCFAHWILMVIWLISLRSLFQVCGSKVEEVTLRYIVLSKLGEIALSFVLAAVYLFSFINAQEEPTKNKYIAYYIICEFENIIMISLHLAFGESSHWYYVAGPVFHFVSFVLGLVMMVAYYKYLHPTIPYNSIVIEKLPNSSDMERPLPPQETDQKVNGELITERHVQIDV
ncbi:hypothetical protein SK128_004016 [Halocaridina rubra]|uniref:XK-related protein n=1 Tax=Halocaridina rubra TaxID=373956 RepID=A0AAN8XA39_HALRR